MERLGCTGLLKRLHTYASSGNYSIRIVVSDPTGLSAPATLRVTIPSPAHTRCPVPSPSALGAKPLALYASEPAGVLFSDGAAYVPGKILVKVRVGALTAFTQRVGARVLSIPQPGWVSLKVPSGQEQLEAEKLVNEGLVEIAQPVYRYRPLSEPNDTYFAGYQRFQFGQLGLIEGWDWLSEKACRPIVATIDTGADLNHTDLAPNLLPGYDFSDNDSDPSDTDGHGTLVAGVIGAVTNNNQGVAGSSDNLAYVLPVRVFPNATSDVLASAIRWAVDAGAHVINLSLCVTDSTGAHCADLRNNPDALIEDALRYAYDHGVIAVAASGNDGYSYVGYPASSPYTLAVGSVDASGNRSSFSNYGSDLDFVAPGEDVTNTLPNGAYGTGSGTSFATPYLAGELALYLGQYYAVRGSLPGFNQAVTCFENNTNQASRNDQTGFGVPQADQFLDVFDGSCYP